MSFDKIFGFTARVHFYSYNIFLREQNVTRAGLTTHFFYESAAFISGLFNVRYLFTS